MARKAEEDSDNYFQSALSEDEDVGWNEVVSDEEYEEYGLQKSGSHRVPSLSAEELYHTGELPVPEETLIFAEKPNNSEKCASLKPIQRMTLNDHKAGMQGLDKEKINQIIFEASKGSKYYENEKKKEKRVKEKIKSLKELMQTFTDLDYQNARKEVREFVRKAKMERDLSRIIVHIDMDAFYAAVETRDNPALKDIPMAVGSNSMLCTSNYAARKYGVRAAMPGFIAKKLCPNLRIVPTNFEKYRKVSNQVREILKVYDPNFCGMGLDEAYLDLTDYVNGISLKSGDSEFSMKEVHPENDSQEKQNLVEMTVNEIREKIFKHTQLTASAGIACNVMLAKVCSDMNKPNGQYYLPPDKDTVLKFVADLPIRKVSGIGRVSEQILNELDITKCGDLLEKKELLYLLFSEISFQHFMRISLGISSTFLDNDSERKSMSVETTFQEISDPEKLFQVCKELCEGLSNDLQKKNLAGKSITVKFKLVNFEVKTRTKTIVDYVNTPTEIYNAAKEIIRNQMLACKPGKLRLRLLGVRVSEFGKKEKVFQNNLDAFLSRPKVIEPSKEDAVAASSVQEEPLFEKKSLSGKLLVLSECDTCSICPVCQTPQKANNINSHIDSCLSKVAIKRILSEDSKDRKFSSTNENESVKKRKATKEMADSRKSKKITLQSFWGKI